MKAVKIICLSLLIEDIWIPGVILQLMHPAPFNEANEIGIAVSVFLCTLILWGEMRFPKTIEGLLDRAFAHRIIPNCDGDPYLFRWYVFKSRWVSLFVHKFVRSDEDRALHDHPWAFLVIPIWRGYVEHSDVRVDPKDLKANLAEWVVGRREVKRRVWPIIGTRLRPATYRHRVKLIPAPWINAAESFDYRDTSTADEYRVKCIRQVLPSWSLFFHFPKIREWGFWPSQGFVKWNIWSRDHKCVE